MNDFIIRFLIAGGVMAVFDAFWLTVVASKFYKNQIGSLLLEKPNLTAAVIFYGIYVVGIVAFVLSPALEKGSWMYALGYGALFGFVAYATYDLTNLSTLKGFTTKVVIVDMIWGVCLTAAVSVISYWIIKQWIS
ncbi:MAG: conserved rane protein of unknown function [Candidatus Saccharibacteria bacterium]|jgi:uncharacterized membrane protein|nr:conserved rane protein of unknown function [Candidatus Saccharibacteria bacterium]